MRGRENKAKNFKRCATLIILVTTFLVYHTAYAEIQDKLLKAGGDLKNSITGFAANVKTNGIGTAISTSPRIAGAYNAVTSVLPSRDAIVGAIKSAPGKAWNMVPILGTPSAGATPQQDNSPAGQLKQGNNITVPITSRYKDTLLPKSNSSEANKSKENKPASASKKTSSSVPVLGWIYDKVVVQPGKDFGNRTLAGMKKAREEAGGYVSNPKSPACKDCHTNRVPDNTKANQKEVWQKLATVGDNLPVFGRVSSPVVQATQTTTETAAPNPNDINPASAKAPIGQYHNDGTRVGDRSIRDLKYAVVPKTGESTEAFTKAKATYDKFYGNAPQADPARAEVSSGSTIRTAVMKNSQGNAVYQNWQGISPTITNITGADNKAVTYEAHAKSMVDNIKSSINSGNVTAIVNGASVAVKSFVFSSRANSFDEGTNGVLTQEGKFIPARLITAISNNGKTTYDFALPKNIGDSLKDVKGTTFRNGAFSVDIK